MINLRNSYNQPIIFIIGESRSGKTLIGNLIAIHKNTYWFSNITNKFVDFPILSLIHRLRDLPIVGDKIKKNIINNNGFKFLPRPSEGDNIYHSFCRFEHSRWTTEENLTKHQSTTFTKIIKSHQRFTQRSCFINDQSANIQRIRQIVKIFPKAKFIHVIRDGRAVANEMLQTKWWRNNDIWWLGSKPDAWDKYGREPVVLCGLDWKKCINTIFDHLDLFKDRYLEIRYEDLTENPKKTLMKTFKFCGLDWYEEYSKYIPAKITNKNSNIYNDLTQTQIDELNYELGDLLSYLKYI